MLDGTLLRIRRGIFHFAAILAVCSAAAPMSAQTLVVSPNASAATRGNTANLYPFNTNAISSGLTTRYQQVYAASEFVALTGPMIVTQIVFRANADTLGDFDTIEPDIQINLSTTTKQPDGLSSTFADNAGADDTVVVPRGSLRLHSAGVLQNDGTKQFDITINLQQPFLYDRSKGNLLLEVRAFAGTSSIAFDTQFTSGDGVSRVVSTDVNAATGTPDTRGLITRFAFLPNQPPFYGASGLLTLDSMDNPVLPITFIYRLANASPAVSYTFVQTPDAAGNFSLPKVPAGKYSLWIKGSQWLAVALPIDLTTKDVTGLTAFLRGGDADNNNSVDIADFSILVNSYNGDVDDPTSNYDPRADFNGDGLVDIADFGILVNNYGRIGAP